MGKEELVTAVSQFKHLNNLDDIRDELSAAIHVKNIEKDIIIVVKDQLPFVKICIESIIKNTKDYNLYIWDNGSRDDTREYLESINPKVLLRSETNIGFLSPNNQLAKLTTAPYIILLNSDTEVRPNWDKAMIGWLQLHKNVRQVGYAGAVLNEEFKGGTIGFGSKIDYIPGWSMCIARETYNEFGLFDDDNLKFAYCEDADLSLRIKEAGYEIYALYADLVAHYENKTVMEINADPEFRNWFSKVFEENHAYMQKRWKDRKPFQQSI